MIYYLAAEINAIFIVIIDHKFLGNLTNKHMYKLTYKQKICICLGYYVLIYIIHNYILIIIENFAKFAKSNLIEKSICKLIVLVKLAIVY